MALGDGETRRDMTLFLHLTESMENLSTKFDISGGYNEFLRSIEDRLRHSESGIVYTTIFYKWSDGTYSIISEETFKDFIKTAKEADNYSPNIAIRELDYKEHIILCWTHTRTDQEKKTVWDFRYIETSPRIYVVGRKGWFPSFFNIPDSIVKMTIFFESDPDNRDGYITGNVITNNFNNSQAHFEDFRFIRHMKEVCPLFMRVEENNGETTVFELCLAKTVYETSTDLELCIDEIVPSPLYLEATLTPGYHDLSVCGFFPYHHSIAVFVDGERTPFEYSSERQIILRNMRRSHEGNAEICIRSDKGVKKHIITVLG